MILRALSLVALAVSSVWALPAGRPAPVSLHGGTDTSLLRQASTALRHHSLRHVLTWLRQQSDVQSAAVGEDGRSLFIRYRDGTRAAVLPSTWQTVGISPGSFSSDIRVGAPARAPGARALVMEPFASELGLGPNAGDVEVHYLQTAGFQVDQLYDTQVTVSSMASLSKYNVVYMHTHSGVNPGGDAVVATGELANNDASVAPLLQNGTVIKVGVSGSNQTYYGITSAYIRTYEGQFPGNSILFLNGCNLLSASTFWAALQAKGAGVLISWDKEATSKDNYLGAAAFFAEASQGMSVSGAINAEKAAGYGKSDVGNGAATLGFLGNGSLTLGQAANPPPVTPTPVSTTAPTSTPAPTVTPTRVAGPPLALALKTHVAPGSKQVLTITSAPNTTLRIRIVFPNGDTRSATMATDSSGHARFVYLQHSNKVSRGRVFATITINATKNGAASTLSKRYRISWSRIDIDVQPHTQAVGQAVDIWVHTSAHTSVALGLHFPTGKVRRLHGVTGAAGWTRFVYGVDGRFLKARNRTIVVRATVHLHGKIYRNQTRFSVK